MTRLFARIRVASEAPLVAQAGFDGVIGAEAGAVTGALARLLPDTDQPDTIYRLLDSAASPAGAVRVFATVPDAEALAAAAASDAVAVLVDRPGRLLENGVAPLGVARMRCRALGLACGFAGGLEPPDVPRLLPVSPDWLVLGAALRDGAGALDPARLALFRALVPSEGEGERVPVVAAAPDCIFLRDFVLAIEVGAYAGERGRRQRVRFGVEAELRPLGRPARDMRDVVSYDLFADTIAALTADRHVDFVETLAEEIAAAVLLHPRIRRVRVSVEKLDVGPGSVGVAIERQAE